MTVLCGMTFLRTEKKKSGTYLRLVDSVRQDGKVRQITVASLGRSEDYTPEMLRRIGRRFMELGGEIFTQPPDKQVVELGRFNYGFPLAVRDGLRRFGLDKLFDRLSAKHKLAFSLTDVLTLLVSERLCEPASKLATFQRQTDYFGLPELELQHIYRALNYFGKYKEKLQNQIFMTGRDIFNLQLDVVFYDVTTFYFDSENEDDLRAQGFGKDGKIGKSQVVFGMLIDKHKNPVAYQVYRGNTAEIKTFVDVVNTLKKRYLIDKVVVVADRGMLSRTNLEAVSEHYEYAVGERLKSLPESVKSQLIDLKNYRHSWTYERGGKRKSIKYCTIQHQKRTIICTFSEKRAKRDAAKREKRIEKAKRFLERPAGLKNKARHHFIRSEGEKYYLDEAAIRAAKKYDGYLAVSTNSELPAETILEQYRQLFKIVNP